MFRHFCYASQLLVTLSDAYPIRDTSVTFMNTAALTGLAVKGLSFASFLFDNVEQMVDHPLGNVRRVDAWAWHLFLVTLNGIQQNGVVNKGISSHIPHASWSDCMFMLTIEQGHGCSVPILPFLHTHFSTKQPEFVSDSWSRPRENRR